MDVNHQPFYFEVTVLITDWSASVEDDALKVTVLYRIFLRWENNPQESIFPKIKNDKKTCQDKHISKDELMCLPVDHARQPPMDLTVQFLFGSAVLAFSFLFYSYLISKHKKNESN